MPQTWLIVGASRGIGFEFTRQLLARGEWVIATARPPDGNRVSASQLWRLTGLEGGQRLRILECDVSAESSIEAFAELVRKLGRLGGVLMGGVIDVCVLNAGVLVYPNRASEISFSDFAHHLNTNTIGPILTASHLLRLSTMTPDSASPIIPSSPIRIRNMVFISSDSGSTANFRSFEDGFAAYAASKAALNQALRHMAAEAYRKERDLAPIFLALHPGEVVTDMATNVSLDWDIDGIITPEESIKCMLKVIEEKGRGGIDEGGRMSGLRKGVMEEKGAATFWTWEGKRHPW